MAGIEEKAVTLEPRGVGGIEVQIFSVEQIDELGTAHGAAGMAGFCLFHHGGGKDANLIRGRFESLFVHFSFLIGYRVYRIAEHCIGLEQCCEAYRGLLPGRKTLFLSENLGSKTFENGTGFLPAAVRESGLPAEAGEKFITIPALFSRNLRQQES